MIAALISVAGCWLAAVVVFLAVLGLCAAVERWAGFSRGGNESGDEYGEPRE